jgi:hypothetical protein
MIIPPNIGSEICFVLLIASVYVGRSRPVRRVVKFRYIIVLMAALVILAALSGGR